MVLMKLIRLIIAAILFILTINPAQASRSRNTFHIPTPSCNNFFMQCPSARKPPDFTRPKAMWQPPTFSMPFAPPTAPVHGFIHYTPSVGSGVVEHPSGCPHRAFCGCGAAVHLFGSPIRALWLAANWFKFPQTAPAPRMAAVRRHHVFILERQINGNMWEVYDANSGHHTTRIHVKSISGYRIVN